MIFVENPKILAIAAENFELLKGNPFGMAFIFPTFPLFCQNSRGIHSLVHRAAGICALLDRVWTAIASAGAFLLMFSTIVHYA